MKTLLNAVWVRVLIICISLAPTSATFATTGGVFGPVVNPGHKSWQYRGAYNDGGFSQRIHYQQSVTPQHMWRIVGQTRNVHGESSEYDFLQAELFWQLPNVNSNWQQGLRFDLRHRDSNRPNQFGINWMHQFRLGPDWSARALLLTTRQFGDNGRDGIGIQARGALTRHLAAPGAAVSLSWFGDMGTTTNWAAGNNQSHQIGPTAQFNFAQGWQAVAGVLVGVTEPSPDLAVRLWITRSL